jgi:hypothetical protein
MQGLTKTHLQNSDIKIMVTGRREGARHMIDRWEKIKIIKRRKYIMRLETLGQLKNPMTSSGMEPATFRPSYIEHIL